MTAKDTSRRWTLLGGALVALWTTLWCLSFLDYGIGLRDEGTLLAQFARVARGERLYHDFHIGYSPPFYFLQGWILANFGPSLFPIRIALALVHLVGALCTFRVLVAVGTRTLFAVLAGVAYLAVLPVYAGQFAIFNTPYPAWYNSALWIAGAAVCLRFASTGSAATAALAGVLSGLAFCCKPNVGVFQLAATAFLLLAANPLSFARGRLDLMLWWGWWLATVAGVVVVFQGAPSEAALAPILGPSLMCAALVIPTAIAVGRTRPRPPMGVLGSAVSAGAGFGAMTVPWLSFYYRDLGQSAFLERVLFLGSGYEQWFFLPHPSLKPWMFLAAAVVPLLALLPRVVDIRRYRLTWMPAAGLFAVLAGLTYAAISRPMPGGFVRSLDSAFAAWRFEYGTVVLLALVAHWASVFLSRSAASGEEALRRGVVAIMAAFVYLQVYPRTDAGHWVMVAGPVVAGALYLCSHLADRWLAGTNLLLRWPGAIAFLLPALLPVCITGAESLMTKFHYGVAGWTRVPEVVLDNPRAPVRMAAGLYREYEHLAAVSRFLEKATEPAEAIFTFPVLDIVYFLADRPNPTRHGYFFQGFVGHDVEAEVQAMLVRRPPRFLVLLDEATLHFGAAPFYYYGLIAWAHSNYREVRAFGPYLVMARNDVVVDGGGEDESAPRVPANLAAHVERLQGGTDEEVIGALSLLESARLSTSLPAVETLLWSESRDVSDAAAMALRYARDPRGGCVLLRAVLDGRLSAEAAATLAIHGIARLDPECAGELFRRGWELPPRLAHTAGGMLDQTLHSFLRSVALSGERATKAEWPQADMGRDGSALLRAIRGATFFSGPQDFGVVWARSVSKTDAIGALRWAQYSMNRRAGLLAALQLEGLGAGDPSVLERSLPLLTHEVVFTPWMLLQFADREDFDAVLAQYIAQAPERPASEALWLAAVAGGPHCIAAAEKRRDDPSSAVRRAALWVLLARNASSAPEAIDRATTDVDPRVREIAAAWIGSDFAAATRGLP